MTGYLDWGFNGYFVKTHAFLFITFSDIIGFIDSFLWTKSDTKSRVHCICLSLTMIVSTLELVINETPGINVENSAKNVT